MSTTNKTEDTERDPWLSEALRHAPDAEAAPPAALSDAILRKARAATGATSTGGDETRSTHHARTRSARTSPASMWASAWAWLLRPPVASSFATVLVGVLVGVMWQGRSPEETLGRAPAADASPPAAATVASTPAPAPIASVAEPAPRSDAAQTGEVPTARRSERAREVPPAPAPSRVPSPARESADPAKRDAPEPSRAAVAPKASVRDEAPSDLASAPSTPSSPAFATAPAPAPATALRLRESAPAANTDAAAAADSRSASAGAAPRSLAKVAPTRSNDLEALRVAIEADPTRWRWQRGETLQPMTPALRGWLAQLTAATASRWRQEPEPAAFDDATVLKLYRDGMLSATLRLTGTDVRLDGDRQAALTADSLATLRQALDAATR